MVLLIAGLLTASQSWAADMLSGRQPDLILDATLPAQPSITAHLPVIGTATGAAIIVCPGGGYGGLTMGPEGHDTAAWFAEHGVAGIVLKYRLPVAHGADHGAPLEDAHHAITMVRAHAAEWGIDAHRVGILGYSAGGHLASTAGTHFDGATRPDFMLLIYPVITMGEHGSGGTRTNLLGPHPDPTLVAFYSNELQVTKDTPPAFLVHAEDDHGVSPLNSVNFYLAMQAAGVPVELHVYETGDHGMKSGAGWGIGGPTKNIASSWPDRAIEWMRQRGVLGHAAP
jgi:acetyl esterase/lipase